MSNEVNPEFEEKDDHIVQSVVSKAEERLLLAQPEFETVCTKYWTLIRQTSPQDENTITRHQYVELLTRIYRVLAPLYREVEMKDVVNQEWNYDCHGQDTMDQGLFSKFIFRIAHQWATSIDVAEYCELLDKVYQRIVHRKIARASGRTDTAYPHIQVSINQDKQPQHEDFGEAEWESCQEDEEQDVEDYIYETRDNGKSYRQRKPESVNENPSRDIFLTARDPFYYKEEVLYYQFNEHGVVDCAAPSFEDFEYDVLTDHSNIFPLGYPTEQYLCWIKNDVYKALAELKAAKKKTIAAMKRDLFNGTEVKKTVPSMNVDRERGLIEESGQNVTQYFNMHTSNTNVKVQTSALMHDATYNSFRGLFKDNTSLSIRPSFENPSRKGYSEKSLELTAPLKRFSVFGFNPAIERRLNYVLSACRINEKEVQMWINVNYLVVDQIFETAFRADVNRIETKSKMCVKPNEEFTRDEDFNNVTTMFREAVQIMLQKKYESFFTVKLQGDSEAAIERDETIFELQRNKRKASRIYESLQSKNLKETFEVEIGKQDYLRLIRGPFWKLDSKSGPLQDNFDKCGSQDLIDIANQEVMRIVIVAKPRSGKTTLAKQLEARLNVVRIAADQWIDNLFKKLKDREENPPEEEPVPDLDDGQEPPLKKSWLEPLEEQVLNTLKAGGCPTEAEICEMLKQMIASPEAQTRGLVIDLDYAYSADDATSWVSKFQNYDIMNSQQITHVIELVEDNYETKYRANQLLQTPADGVVYSKWQRDLRANRKKPVDEDGNEIEEEEEVALQWKLLPRIDLVQRVCDNEQNILNEISQYDSPERPDVDNWIVKMFASTYVKISIAGLIPDEIAETVVQKLKPNQSEPITPFAKIIEGASDFGSLLTTDVNIDEGQLQRQYSLWGTTDPVALTKGKVVMGVPEFAAHYANNVFAFENENNLKNFVRSPRDYLKTAPAMPADYRVLLVGPAGSGVHSQAQFLNEHYGWRMVDFNKIVKDKLAKILSLTMKPPNNLTNIGPCMVCMSNEELQEIKDGKPFPSWKFLPWIMEFLGVPLVVKPAEVKVVVEPNVDDMNEEERKSYEKEQKKKLEEKKKKDKEEAEAKAAKDERAKKRQEAIENGMDLAELGLEESEEEIKIDDLPIDQLAVQKDADGNFPKIGQIVMFGFPQSELHIQKMKEYGLIFDRVILLNDLTEEEPGREIKKRMQGRTEFVYDYDEEIAKTQKVIANIKEFIGEEGVVEVDCTGSKPDVFIKLRTKIDPYFVQVDSDDIKFDYGQLPNEDEENPRRGPKSDFGDYCPVTYTDSGFLVKGKPDFEAFVFGKSYRFAGEKEIEKFKFNPSNYLKKVTIPLPAPDPKIMIVGLKGSGVTTQINMLASKYKIGQCDLKDKFLELLKEEKLKRRRGRLLQRGFKEPAPIEDDQEPEVDAEIEDDPAEFVETITTHYQELLQKIIAHQTPLVINGNWSLPEDLEVNLADTMVEARRTPEVVVVLKCKEANTFKRCIDDQAIKLEYEADCKKRQTEIDTKFDEDRKEKLKELQEENKQDPEAEDKKSPEEVEAIIQEAIKTWDDERKESDKQALEDDPVPDEKTRREAIEELMRTQLEKDAAFLEEFVEKMKENGVEVIDNVSTDISAEYVHIKLLDKLKTRIQLRTDLIEREQAQKLKLQEVKFYEDSYTYKHSKFGLNSPLNQFNPQKTKEFAVLYRERIYFLGNKNEQELFMAQPSLYTNLEPVPQDLMYRPTAVVTGLPASGKSTLSSIISTKTGMVHLRPEEIIQQFINRQSVFSERLCKKTQIMGDEVDDLTFIEMLQLRIQMKDCCQNGWVLDGFPQTRSQAVLLARAGIVPDNCFLIQVPVEEVYNRTVGRVQSDFLCDRSILVKQLIKLAKTVPETGFFYNKFFSSLVSVDGKKSRWYMEDLALEQIEKVIKANLEFARDYFFKTRPCTMGNMHCDLSLLKQSISQFGYMCPVSWKVNKKFVNCNHRPQFCVFYNNFFFYFANEAQRQIFVNDPHKFTKGLLFCHERNIPKRYRFHKASEIISQEKALLGHCPVTLKDENKVEKGYQLSVVNFKDSRYVFVSEEKASRFFLNPARYHSVQLPVKMPPPKDNVLLHALYQKGTNETELDASKPYMEQALGSIVTRALREVGTNRLKYPTLSVKETMLKLFAIFLKAENPANTEYMRTKYHEKMQKFIYRCEVPTELHELSIEKKEKLANGRLWPQFKEDYYNKLGAELDEILRTVPKECSNGFASYMK